MDLWAGGIYDLGLIENDFWRLTLLQFDALIKRHSLNMDRLDYRTARIESAIYNGHGIKKKGKSKHIWTPDVFLAKKPMTQGNMMKKVEQLNRLFGGKDIRNG